MTLIFSKALAAFSLLLSGQALAAAALPCGTPQDRFRAHFLKAVRGVHSPAQVATYLYRTPEPLEKMTNLDQIRSEFAALAPSGMQQEGMERWGCAEDLAQEDDIPAQPLTLVMFPPLAAEFCSSLPFGDVLGRTDSALAVQWRQALSERKLWTQGFDLNRLEWVRRPLGETVSVASIDDKEGHPRIHVLYLNPPRGSLESLGSPERTVAYLLPRLRTALEVLHLNGDLHLMGYSRGANLAMEALTQAWQQPEKNSWAARVRTVVTVAGVNFGALAADDALTPGTPIHRVLAPVRSLAAALEIPDSESNPLEKAALGMRNTARWTWALGEVAARVATFPFPSGLLRESTQMDVMPSKAMEKVLRSLFFDVFNLDHPVGDYGANVRRFQVFVREFFASVQALTTESRLNWWRTHRIPEGVRLVSLGATLGDSWNDRAGTWPLAFNPLTVSRHSLDFSFLRLAYYYMQGHSQVTLGDGLVSLERTYFWPEIIRGLNGQSVEAVNLGLIGADHFSLGMSMAAPARQKFRNPFPHAALLESLGTWLSQR